MSTRVDDLADSIRRPRRGGRRLTSIGRHFDDGRLTKAERKQLLGLSIEHDVLIEIVYDHDDGEEFSSVQHERPKGRTCPTCRGTGVLGGVDAD